MRVLRGPYRQAMGAISALVFVILLALVPGCGAWAAALPSSDMDSRSPETALIFYAQTKVRDDLWPLLFQILLDDLSAGDGELTNGVVLDKQPAILRGSDPLRGVSFPRIVSVKLLGRCELLPQASHASGPGPLGWVMLVSGKVQPFISIDCARIAQVLGPASVHMTKQGRQYAMAQAISHVLIHEWIHIANQSSSHSARGLSQAYLSVDDLIAAPKNNRLSASTR